LMLVNVKDTQGGEADKFCRSKEQRKALGKKREGLFGRADKRAKKKESRQ